jgi:hypothetical protein
LLNKSSKIKTAKSQNYLTSKNETSALLAVAQSSLFHLVLLKRKYLTNTFQNSNNIKQITKLLVVNSSVGGALAFSHEGPQFKLRRRHLFVS